MKNLLLCTDFSPSSERALDYGIELNKKLGGEIHLFHSYFLPLPATSIPVALPSDITVKKGAGESLNNIKEKYKKSFPTMVFKSILTEGFPEIEIIKEQRKLHSDLIIMGTKGLGPIKNFFPGSTSVRVMREAACPVIVVPENTKIKSPSKIVFAANYATDDYKNVSDLLKFAKGFGAEVILLHVSDDSTNHAFDYNQLSMFKDQLVKEGNYDKVGIKIFDDTDVFEGINIYLEEIKADMIALSMRNRSFLKRVFQPGLSRKMIYHTHIPLIIFHTELQP